MKLLIFVPLLIIIIPLVLGIVGFGLLVGKLAKNAKKDEWEGKVVNKMYREKEEEDNKVSGFCTLIIKTIKGEERKIPVTPEVYKKAKIGDKYIKVKGKLNPEKV